MPHCSKKTDACMGDVGRSQVNVPRGDVFRPTHRARPPAPQKVVQVSELPVVLCNYAHKSSGARHELNVSYLDYVKQNITTGTVSNYEIKTTWSKGAVERGPPTQSQRQAAVQGLALRALLDPNIEVNTSVLVSHVLIGEDGNPKCVAELYGTQGVTLVPTAGSGHVPVESIPDEADGEGVGGKDFADALKLLVPDGFLERFLRANKKFDAVSGVYGKGAWRFAKALLSATAGKLQDIREVAELGVLLSRLSRNDLDTSPRVARSLKLRDWSVGAQQNKDDLATRKELRLDSLSKGAIESLVDGFEKDAMAAKTIARAMGLFIQSDVENNTNTCGTHPYGGMRNLVPTGMNGLVRQLVFKIMDMMRSPTLVYTSKDGYSFKGQQKRSAVCLLDKKATLLEEGEYNVSRFLSKRPRGGGEGETEYEVEWSDDSAVTWETQEDLAMDPDEFAGLVSDMESASQSEGMEMDANIGAGAVLYSETT